MKKIVLFVLFFSLSVFAQKKEELFIFENSQKWEKEIIEFPIDWAPNVKLNGFEELLFSPNWKTPKSDEFWTLIMGWKVNAINPLLLKEIENNFRSYFDGLMKPNHWATKFPTPKVSFKMKNGSNFVGKMTFFDGFHTGKVITVNVQGNQYFYSTQQKTIISFRISSKEFKHSVWETLNQIKIRKN